MMKEQIKYLWIDALTSGEYQQAKSRLRDNNKFCCLGVLCDLYHKETGLGSWIPVEDGGSQLKFMGKELDLPEDVMDWAGLHNKSDGEYTVTNEEEIEEQSSLSYDNDSGASFKTIAETIEKYH